LQMRRVIVPPAAGVFSAVGLLCADLEAVRSTAFLRALDADSAAEVAKRCGELEREALSELNVQDGVVVHWRAELRYAGQGFELPVDLARDATGVAAIRERFEREYRRTYGHELEGHRIDFVALRVTATVPPRGPATFSRMRRALHRAPTAPSRRAYFGPEDGLLETQVIERGELTATPRVGPLIVEEYEGTTVVPPRATAIRDELNNIVITLSETPSRAV
jgi:N-methylhydantoinase A